MAKLHIEEKPNKPYKLHFSDRKNHTTKMRSYYLFCIKKMFGSTYLKHPLENLIDLGQY